MTFFDLLNQKKYLALFLLMMGVFFALNYAVIARLPGEKDLMCVVGGGLMPLNLTFALILSAMVSLLIMGFVGLFSQKKIKVGWKAGSTSTFGMVIGVLTTFCTFCTLPVVSLFGVGVGLGFITEYEWWFKVASLIILGLSIYLLNNQLKEKCKVCVE